MKRLGVTHSICLTIIVFALIAGMLALPAAPAECSETYTSANSNYPIHYGNKYHNYYYDVVQLDAVYFAGKEVIFFTMDSDTDNKNFLYYYSPGVSGSNYYFDLQLAARDATWAKDLASFKALVFNNTLYVFYAYNPWSYVPDKIYYRTATVDFGSDGTAWKLVFSEEKSISVAGAHPYVMISSVVMNGKIFLIFEDYWNNYDWYYVSSADGLNFDAATWLFDGSAGIFAEAAGSTVFPVPDATLGFKERVMIAYANNNSSYLNYFFFDGESPPYGAGSVQVGVSGIRSARLFAGTAEGYTNNKFAIQVFCATPSSSGDRWSYMYHGEYIPSGTEGASGQWRPTWTKLSLSSDDQVYTVDNPAWAIIPYFQDEDADQRMNLRIWYAKDTDYTYKMFGEGYQTVKLRYSTYKSDLLEHASDTLPPNEPDMNSSPIIGVILGTPPYPANNGVPTTDSAGTSTVVLETSQTVTFATTWTATAGTAVSFGKKFGPVNMQTKLTAGVKHSKEQSSGTAVYQTDTLQSYNYMSHLGGLAWAFYLKPKFLTDQYILRGFDGSTLTYDGNDDELRVSLITYDGTNTTLDKKAFYINNPSDSMGGTDTSTQIFAGMAPMPFSSDFCAYDVAVTSTNSYKISEDYLPSFSSTQGDRSYTKFTETTTNGVTNGFNAGFSATASAFGFTADGNVNFSMDFKTTTSMTQSLGFGYAVPPCGPQGSTIPCISDVTVYPYLLVPNDDDTGYRAPWISDDIRNFKKPKPWAITYSAIPSNKTACTATSVLAATPIAVQSVQGTLLLNEGKPDRDKLSGKISLIVPRDFLLNPDEWVHLRLGNFFTDSDTLQVISRSFEDRNLVLELKGKNSDSSITVKLSYNRNTSVLDIYWKADRIDLTPLHAYRFLGAGKPTNGETDFGLYLGGKYFAKSELNVHCAANDRNAICNFHSK